MKAYISCLLEFKKSGDGIFGNVSAYYAIPEEQGRGVLHLHMLVWLEGYTSPFNLKEMMHNDSHFKQEFLKYLETVIKQQSPLYEEISHSNDMSGTSSDQLAKVKSFTSENIIAVMKVLVLYYRILRMNQKAQRKKHL